MPSYAEVVVTLPIEGRFVYGVPPELEDTLAIGHRVQVAFGGRKVTAFVAGFTETLPPGLSPEAVHPIVAQLDEAPLLSSELIALVRFAAEYYLAPVGEVLKVALPPGLTARSVSSLELTELGRERLARAEDPPEVLAVLRAAAANLPAKNVDPKLRQRLEREGAIGRRQRFSPRSAERFSHHVERIPGRRGEIARSKIQTRLMLRLAAGPAEEKALEAEFERGALRRALTALEEKGLIRRRRELDTGERPAYVAPSFTLELSEAQAAALEAVVAALDARKHENFLLRGVTGSGKTEVYLRAIAYALARGFGAIVLVPEIALTLELEHRFRAHFGDRLVVLHSAKTERERREGWERLRTGEASIALGPRSAVWAPVQNLGIVIVDEEHDGSFKQNNELRYSGRDLALVRAHKSQSVAILGSATPSLESRYAVELGRSRELRLPGRALGRAMPTVEVVDLSRLREKGGEIPVLSTPLYEALREVVSRDEQAILFLNRRGFNTIVVCDDCAEPRTCPSCTVTLTHHRRQRLLACHHCGHGEPFEGACRSCGSRAMTPFGAGTERVADFVAASIEGAKVLRLDRDVADHKGALEDTLARFRRREAQILVGTQMVAKGHDFPRVTLVGILCADASLAQPDFRAAERTFQLITQVAGRAGRAERPGRVIVQAFQPTHYAVAAALAHDDERFFRREIESRRELGYPPFSRLALVRIEGLEQERVVGFAQTVRLEADRVAEEHGLTLRGPAAAPIERIRDRHRQMLLVLAPRPSLLVAGLRQIRQRLGRPPPGVDVFYDVDALDLS